MPHSSSVALTALLLLSAGPASAPSTVIDFPAVHVDRAAKQVRVDCQALAVETPLEFFCVANGGPEHESVLRTTAKASHIHAGLLMLGIEPGSPVRYVESKNAWTAPYGPPIRVSVEWKDADGKLIHRPAESLMRSTRDATVRPKPMGWIFAGSHQREGDGVYLADLTGYIVTLCNFENALVDVPRLVSSANETLEWQADPDGPKRGDVVIMILEPAGELRMTTGPTTRAANDEHLDAEGLTPAQAAQKREINALRDEWRTTMAPHAQAMHDAAKAHYDAIAKLRERQKKLIDEADQLEALIDELDRAYGEMTTPKP
jgi:hypothetical protein